MRWLLLLLLVSLPAAANEPVAFASNGRAVVVLQDVQGTCPAGTKRAILIVDPQIWLGCWAKVRDQVLLQWEDGDQGTAPVSAFRWKPTA